MIALNAGFNDNLDDILDYREDLGIHMPIVVDDGMLASTFNLRITPQHIVIGKDGLVKHIGNLADAELDAVLERERNTPDVPARVVQQTLAQAPHLDAGDMVPQATLTADGSHIALSGPAPNGTVLVFMIPWCESYLATSRPGQATLCREVREQLETLKRQYPETRFVGISSGLWTVEADLKAYASENKVTLPLALDGDGNLFRGFGVMKVPTVIVADAAGKIVKRVEGHDETLPAVLATLNKP